MRWKVITLRVDNFITFCVDVIAFCASITFCGITVMKTESTKAYYIKRIKPSLKNGLKSNKELFGSVVYILVTKQLLGLTFILYVLTFSGGNGFKHNLLF